MRSLRKIIFAPALSMEHEIMGKKMIDWIHVIQKGNKTGFTKVHFLRNTD